jgi:hypothetical protein
MSAMKPIVAASEDENEDEGETPWSGICPPQVHAISDDKRTSAVSTSEFRLKSGLQLKRMMAYYRQK